MFETTKDFDKATYDVLRTIQELGEKWQSDSNLVLNASKLDDVLEYIIDCKHLIGADGKRKNCGTYDFKTEKHLHLSRSGLQFIEDFNSY